MATPQYGAKTQYVDSPNSSPTLDLANTTRVQEILGTLLYYARAVDATMLTAIGSIATQQSTPTQATMQAVTHLLNYCATHPDATIQYIASNLVLHVKSDASYLTAPKARSRAAGYHFLSSCPTDPTRPPGAHDPPPPNNGAIHVLCSIMRKVVSSAAKAELAALFHNGKEANPLRIALEELGHPQPPTTIQTDNSTAIGIATDSIKQKRSKAINMRFYWIRDCMRQGQFHIFWRKGALNWANYFTKHHPASHHRNIRSSYLHEPTANTRNFFDCLYEEHDNTCTSTQDNATNTNTPPCPRDRTTITDCGEGVLISGLSRQRCPNLHSNKATHNLCSSPLSQHRRH